MSYIRKKYTAYLCTILVIIVTLLASTVNVNAAVEDHEVVAKMPQGTVVSLFDYWAKEEDSNDFGSAAWKDISNSGINKNHSLKFADGTYSGFNGWTRSSAPYSGMVSRTLDSSGYPTLATNFGSGIFYPESLAYLFDNSEVEGKKIYENINGLMQVDDKGYYYYDCRKNFASYDSSTNTMKLYDKPAVKTQSGITGQFFPFNSADSIFNDNGSELVTKNISANSNDVNHWFGLTMSTHFIHPEDGKTARNEEITYEFSGDDDVWVFIDDVLVGDLGGIHDAASLKINFHTGEVKINNKNDGTIKSKFEEADKADTVEWQGNTFKGGTYHTLKFFYLERGNYESNMSLKFNLKLMPDNELVKVDQYENPVAGAVFDIYEADRTEKDGTVEYKEIGNSVCSGTTDVNGNIKFKGSDNATINFEELYKKNIGPYFIVKETKAPDGYRKTQDIWLAYDPNTGAIVTENMWDSGVYANARVMITAPTYMYDLNGKRLEMNSDGSLKEGSVFAVIYRRNDMNESLAEKSNWSAVSGSVLEGWKLEQNDDSSGEIEGNKYELKLNSMGAYEVTLDELPGNIMAYSDVIVADNHDKSDEELRNILKKEAEYTIAYYYTNAGSIENATAANSVMLDTGVLSDNTHAREFEYKHAVKMVVTDVTNDLYVKKFDEYATTFNDSTHAVNGVKFALYDESQTTVLSRILPGEIKLKEDAEPVQEQVTRKINSNYGSVDLTGTAIFRKLKSGTYYLKEVSAPSGYKVKEQLIKVIVNDDGAFADAGEKGDGIYVGRGGSGTLLNSMEQFADNDSIDTTLSNMKINLGVYKKNPTEGSSESESTPGREPLHVRYTQQGEASRVGHYKVVSYDDEGNETGREELLEHMEHFTVDEGWPYIMFTQCREHDQARHGATFTDLGDKELRHLLVLESMVMVQDETIGDLKISKDVVNNSSDTSFDDKDFTFKIKLYEEKQGAQGEKQPVSGEFTYIVKGKNSSENSIDTVTFDNNGEAELTIKNAQSIIIRDLPASVKYEVTEVPGEAESYWKVQSKAQNAGDNEEYANSATVKGEIPEPDKDGKKQQSAVAFRNTYEPQAATIDGGIPFTKSFNGWNINGFKDQKFNVRLKAVTSSEGSGNVNDTMPEDAVADSDGMKILIKQIGKPEAFAARNGDNKEESAYIDSSSIFGGLRFTKTGQYVYSMQEIIGDNTDINYSKAVYDVMVTVTDDGNGKLEAAYDITKERQDDGSKTPEAEKDDSVNSAIFKNTYEPQYEHVSLGVHKTYDNATGSDVLSSNQFRFTLEAVDNAPMPETAEGDKITVGNSIGGSVIFPDIRFNTEHGGDEAGGESYVYKVYEVIPDGANAGNNYTLNGLTYDAGTYYIKVTITGSASGSGITSGVKYYSDENCTSELTNDKLYEVTDNRYYPQFSNSYNAEAVSISIDGSKTLNGRAMSDGEFSFMLEAADGETSRALSDDSIYFAAGETDDKTSTTLTATSGAAESGEAGSFKLGQITFTKVGTYQFKVKEVIPDGAVNNTLNGVRYDSNICTVTVIVTDRDDDGSKTGKLSAAVSYENSAYEADNDGADVNKAQFINSYSASGSYAIKASKKITGRDFRNGDSFTFRITPAGDAPNPVDDDGKEITTVTISPESDDTADIDFGKVKFDKAGVTYEYTLEEVEPDDTEAKRGIDYDKTKYSLKLTSEENTPEDGKLCINAQISIAAGNGDNEPNAADSIIWANKYKPAGSIALKGSKTLIGRSWNDDDSFTFTLWAKADDEALLNAVKADEYTVVGDRAVFDSITVNKTDAENNKASLNFDAIDFTKASDKPYEFYITETVPADKANHNGIVYDNTDHVIPVCVTDDGEGNLTAAVEEASKINLDFYNVYSSAVVYSNKAGIVINKTLTGRDMADGQFEFTVKALNNGNNTTAEEAAAKLGFDRYETEKTYSSSAALGGETNTINILNGTSVSYTNEDAGKVYKYEVSETVGGNESKGYTNDKSVYVLTIEVSDNAKGTLTVVTTVTDKASGKQIDKTTVSSESKASETGEEAGKVAAVIPFHNEYKASGSLNSEGKASIEASKILTGRDMKSGEFKFHITNDMDTSEKKTIIASGENEAAKDGEKGAISFSEIRYTTDKLHEDVQNGLAVKDKEGNYVYQYEVSEAADNLPTGVSQVKSTFDILVTVKDNADGTMTASVDYPADTDELVFENLYDTKKAVIPVSGVKVLETAGSGASMTVADIAGKFAFTLTGTEKLSDDETKSAPLPVIDGQETKKAVNLDTGEIDFGDIIIEADDFSNVPADEDGVKTRTFEYTVTESGSAAGVINDSEKSKTFSITVNYDSRNKEFAIEGLQEGAAFRFINTYSTAGADVDADTLIKVNKTLTGRDMAKDEFSFEVVEIINGEEQIVTTGTNEAASAGDKAKVGFEKIVYKQPGEHDYIVREVVPAGGIDSNTIYDTTVYSVHVSVTDNKDGTLSVTSSASDTAPIVFHNKHFRDADTDTGFDDNSSGGSFEILQMKTGDSFNIAAVAAILIIALAAMITLVFVRRRK